MNNPLPTLLHFTSTSIAPSITNAGEHIRSGSPDPLPVPPRSYKDGYHGERTRRIEPERHRSRRGGDYDRSYGHVHGGEVRVRSPACKFDPPRCGVTYRSCVFVYSWRLLHPLGGISRENMSPILSLGTSTRWSTLTSGSQDVRGAKRPCV